MSELTRRIRRKLGEYRPRATIQPARMGLDDGTVEVDGEKYMIWVKLFDGQTLKAINQRVTNKFGKLVQVGYDEVQFPSRLQVLGTWDVYDEPQWAGTPNHADQHAWLGDDPIFLRQEQFTPGLVLPVNGSVSVDVYPFSSFTGGSWYTQTEITRVDVSSGLPTSEGYRYVLLVLKSDQTFGLRLGSVAVSRMELTLDLIPVPTSGDTPLAALALYYGQSELVKEDQNNDIVDLRFLDAVFVEPDLSVYVRKDGTVAFTGVVAGVDPTSAAHLATKNYVDGFSNLVVAETDGVPSVSAVTQIKFPAGAVTDSGGGVATISFGSAAGVGVEEEDGTPAVASVNTIKVPNGTMTDHGGGVVSIDTSGGGSFLPLSGWIGDGNGWTVDSVDGEIAVVHVDADVTGVIQAGFRVRFTQTTAKYFIVVAVGTYSGGVTPITVYGGTDYTATTEAVYSPEYSPVKVPFGFNADPRKWTVSARTTTLATQNPATAGTYYNLGSFQISIPPGIWQLGYEVMVQGSGSAPVDMDGGISTATGSISDSDFFSSSYTASSSNRLVMWKKAKAIEISSRTTYYWIQRNVSGATLLALKAGYGPARIDAVCAYL